MKSGDTEVHIWDMKKKRKDFSTKDIPLKDALEAAYKQANKWFLNMSLFFRIAFLFFLCCISKYIVELLLRRESRAIREEKHRIRTSKIRLRRRIKPFATVCDNVLDKRVTEKDPRRVFFCVYWFPPCHKGGKCWCDA